MGYYEDENFGQGFPPQDDPYGGYEIRKALNFKPMVIKSFRLLETGGYKDQYIRSLALNHDHEIVTKLENMTDSILTGRSGMRRFTPDWLAKTVPDLAMPNKAPIAKIDIPGGFREKRLKFLLELEQEGAAPGITHVTFIQGYTSHLGILVDGTGNVRLDPQMKFYANSVVYLTKTFDSSGHRRLKIVYHFTILHTPKGIEIEDITHQHPAYMRDEETRKILTIRPTDILTAIHQKDLVTRDMYGPSPTIRVTPKTLNVPEVATKSLNIPVAHVAETLNGTLAAAVDKDSIESVYTLAAKNTQAPVLSDIPFFRRISDMHGGIYTNEFTIMDLIQIDPAADDKASIIVSNGANAGIDYFINLYGSDSEELYRPTIENTIATLLAEGATSLLTNNMLKRIHFTFSNLRGENEIFVIPDPNTGLPTVEPIVQDLDIIYWMNRFLTQFENIVIPTATYNGQMPLEFDIMSDIELETILRLRVNNNPEIVYRIPTFADGTFNPNLANDVVVDRITEDYKDLIDTVTVHPSLQY